MLSDDMNAPPCPSHHSFQETFMVFRFSTPLAISVADFMFLGRQLPSPRAWASLGGLLVGAVGYALTDAAFEVKGCVAMRLHPHLQTTKRLRCTHLHIVVSLFACLFACLLFCTHHSNIYNQHERYPQWDATLCVDATHAMFTVTRSCDHFRFATQRNATQYPRYMFCCAWYLVFCLDQVYLKHICNTVKMQSNWGKVYYSNLLASLPLILIGGGTDEITVLREQLTASGIAALTLSVCLGAAMSYFAWAARSMISATSFTVVGNLCKILTIGINVALWDKHASATGIICLLGCLAAAFAYEQAPQRKVKEVPRSTDSVVERISPVTPMPLPTHRAPSSTTPHK
jgi:drug/metabolite transporter (DMT)-like permease